MYTGFFLSFFLNFFSFAYFSMYKSYLTIIQRDSIGLFVTKNLKNY